MHRNPVCIQLFLLHSKYNIREKKKCNEEVLKEKENKKKEKQQQHRRNV